MEKAISNQVVQKKVIYFQGLTCANCAAKIESRVENFPEVIEAQINLVNQTLQLKVLVTDRDQLFQKVKAVVLSLEPGVKVSEKAVNEKATEREQKPAGIFWQLGIGLVFFVAALTVQLSQLVTISLFLISYLIIGGDVLLRAYKNLLRKQIFDENFLMALATLGAFAIREFPEAVSVMIFYKIGESLQSLAVGRSRRSIKALLDIRPEYANLRTKDGLKQINPEAVKTGQTIVVKSGERIPLDGVVISGHSMLDTTALTGESLPRSVEPKDHVLAGCVNFSGLLTIRVTKPFQDSSVAKILDMVQNASARKARTEKFITKFAKYYTPGVVIVAFLLAVIPPLVIQNTTFSEWLYRSLIFLVVSCPCALVISIPLGFFGGIGGASKRGILVKGSNYLEILNEVKQVVFDKTGTLTAGVFKVEQVVSVSDLTKEELLSVAAIAESSSNHPIAKSIVDYYGQPLHVKHVEYQEIAGQGIKAIIDGKVILAGSRKLMIDNRINPVQTDMATTVVHIAKNRKYLGYITISDQLKADSKQTIARLRTLGIEQISMLTGDQKAIAEKVARELKIDQVYPELLPEDKVAKIEDLVRLKRGKVAFIGDGINDAPVLARADVGVAMGALGSDAAIEAADIVLMTDEPSKLVDAIQIAQKTKSIIWQNIILALGTKALVLILGAFGYATMWSAVFADVGVAIIAIFNSLRAIQFRPKNS